MSQHRSVEVRFHNVVVDNSMSWRCPIFVFFSHSCSFLSPHRPFPYSWTLLASPGGSATGQWRRGRERHGVGVAEEDAGDDASVRRRRRGGGDAALRRGVAQLGTTWRATAVWWETKRRKKRRWGVNSRAVVGSQYSDGTVGLNRGSATVAGENTAGRRRGDRGQRRGQCGGGAVAMRRWSRVRHGEG